MPKLRLKNERPRSATTRTGAASQPLWLFQIERKPIKRDLSLHVAINAEATGGESEPMR